MNRSASILIQAGFNSRLAAIKAVTDTGATFPTGQELRAWLRSPEVAAFAEQPDWPTPETRALWLDFADEFAPRDDTRNWSERRYRANVQWHGAPAPPGVPVALHHWNGHPHVLSLDGLTLGVLMHPLNPARRGLVRVASAPEAGELRHQLPWARRSLERLGGRRVAWQPGRAGSCGHDRTASPTTWQINI